METTGRQVIRLRGGDAERLVDQVAVEEPLEIRLGGVPIAVVMRTPGADPDLIRGFVLTEGILLSPDEIADVAELDPHRWNVEPTVPIDAERFRRTMFASSSCGVCGKASIDAVRVAARSLPAGPVVDTGLVDRVMERLARAQPAFAATGGLHAAGVFSPEGEPLVVREDVGRHNAVDKAIGAVAVHRWPVGASILAVSGRLSFEITQKAAVAGIPVVAGISAPSSLAVDLARDLGMTLVGFARQGSMVVYAGEGRLGE